MPQLHTGGLLERGEELATVTAALERAAGGDGAVIVIEGPPGIGKTALLEAARGEALDSGFRLLTARAGEHEREFSWGVVRQLFDPVLAAATDEELAALWRGPAEAARPLFHATGLGPEHDSSFAVSHGLFWLAANIADERPVLLVVDDLHWCDGSSLSFLDYCARRLDGLPLAVLGTLRPREPGADHALLDAFCTNPSAVLVRPQPLSEAGSAAFLEAQLDELPGPGVAAASHRATGGNPLLPSELARTLRSRDPQDDPADVIASGGPAVARTVAIRMRNASADARRLVQAAAVLGDEWPLATAVAIAELDAAADAAARQLVGIDVLKPGASMSFVHPVVRAAIYEDIGPLERSRLHARTAEILEAGGAPLERVAGHLVHVHPAGDPAAFAKLRDASRSALASGDMGAAVTLLRRALAEPPPPEQRTGVLAALGFAAAMRDAPAAIGYLTEAFDGAEDPRVRAAIAELLIRSLQFMEEPRRAVDIGSRVLGELGPEHDVERRRLEAALIELDLMRRAGLGWVRDRIQGAASIEPADYAACAQISLAVGARMRALEITADETVAEVGRALAGGRLLHEAQGSIAQVIPAIALAVADRPGHGISVCDDALRASERTGSALGYVANRIFRAWCHDRAGNVEEVAADAEEAVRAGTAYGTAPAITWSSAPWAEALIEMDQLEQAERRLLTLGPLEDIPNRWHWLTTKLAWSRLLRLRGDAERALQLAREVGAAYEELGGLNPAYIPWRFRASEALLMLPDRSEEARAFAAETVELARRWGAPSGIGAALRLQALAEPDDAEELLIESVAVLEGSEARLERARSLVELGAAQRRANRKGASREPLRIGMDLAESCGAHALVEQARTELRASGMRVRRTAIGGPGSLTPSERRTAELAAQGLSNREIAQQLFVTVKTVEVHLSNTYRKLDIRGRPQLASALDVA